MSLGLAKLLSLLIYPLSLSLLVVALGLLLLLFRRGLSGFLCVTAAVAWLFLCSTGDFSSYLMAGLEDGHSSRAMSSIEPHEAIVLLGGASRGDVHLGTLPDLNQQADRLVYATALFKAGKAPVVLVSGGSKPGQRPEAEQIGDILEVMGVPHRALWLETESRDTHDNAVFSAALLRERGLKKVLLVTSAFHMPRALAVFAVQDLEVTPAPTDFQRVVGDSTLPSWLPSVDNLFRSTYALHERAGYWVYRFRGWTQ